MPQNLHDNDKKVIFDKDNNNPMADTMLKITTIQWPTLNQTTILNSTINKKRLSEEVIQLIKTMCF